MFGYDQRGILDSTHLRFFTRKSIRRLIERHGFQIRRIETVGLPFDAFTTESSRPRWLGILDHFLLALWPTMFGYQFIIEVTPRPEYARSPRLTQLR
jgi:hypothetical protein